MSSRPPEPPPAAPTPSPWRAWLPGPAMVGPREGLRIVAGAALGLLLTALLCRAWAGDGALPWLVAPLGASAVLVFAVPASPLAQPWPVVGGNTVSALIGVLCVQMLPDPAWAGPVATALAIGTMLWLRCLHPPGGAMALYVALAHISAPAFVLFPAFTNSLLLMLAGVAYQRATGRSYPHHAPARAPSAALPRFSTADIDAVLARREDVLDISREDLASLLQDVEAQAYGRQLGARLCGDVMTREPVSVEFGTALQDAWTLMHQRRIKALPVIDRTRRVVGIVTQSDFFRHAEVGPHQGFGDRLRRFIRASGLVATERPEVVGQIMTRQVRVATDSRPIVDLVALFSEGGHHHIPIIDAERRLVGMITQTDFVRALAQAAVPGVGR